MSAERGPRRLLESGTSLERALLDSHRFESPSDELGRKVLSAMAAVPRPTPVTEPSFWSRPHVIVVGVAAMGLAAIAFVPYLRPPEVVPEVVPGVVATTPAQVEAPQQKSERSDPEPVVTPGSLPDAPPPPARPAAPAAKPPASVAAPTASIERETELLDRVKSSLATSNSSGAARDLDAYDVEFPRGTLRPEATVLRVRTLLLQGDRAGARRLGDDFVAKHPNGVHAKRIRALVHEE